ncbi:hypothetical protein AVEN_133825-1 [Araneus ventricosus]|uniref:Uncharacterized protein n=1 Tax=Araneus ventricosus TaxID=182803 RepID=A0A4Y2PRG9_ARAVE|nr:hypothetical protein AVEN_255120-1 [Araneus ventricosus]GBN53171.1 hypothetical protein AVEN_133825-1 [Araneus ventricosus]
MVYKQNLEIEKERVESDALLAIHFLNSLAPACILNKHINTCLQIKWQSPCDQEVHNKFHGIKLVTKNWSDDISGKRVTNLTSFIIKHTRIARHHLLLGEPAPNCSHCKCSRNML